MSLTSLIAPGKHLPGGAVRSPGRLLALAAAGLMTLASGAVQPAACGITVVSYHLRDRAVVLDSLVMRKRMIFAFKCSGKLSELRGAAVAGELSCQGRLMARDTTYLFDQAAGNLGFCLPYEIPDSDYRLDIRVAGRKGTLLDSYSGSFERKLLRPYFQRGINFWDFTQPYAHLECSGYGELTYRFSSDRQLRPGSLQISARMTSDNRFPALVEVSLNGVGLGRFELPAPGEGQVAEVVSWRVDEAEALQGVSVRSGENSLSISLPEELNPKGIGIRIFAQKNSPDPALGEAVPITLSLVPEDGRSRPAVFRIPVWGEEGEHITTKFSSPDPEGFTEEVFRPEEEPFPLGSGDVSQGYVVFSRSCLRYVYPWTVPAADEKVDSLGVRLARSDFEPLTFSLYPVRELGRVRVSVGQLSGPGGRVISPDDVAVYVVKTVKVRSGGTRYRLYPRLLERTDCTCIPLGYTTRFWLTVHADSSTAPGLYRGGIRIVPEKERAVELPLTVEVLPITLEQVPGIAYSMFMTYEFFELETKEWNAEEREKIYRDGVEVFRDFRDHGLTTVDVSSPFYFQWNADGTPRLEHFKGMIRGAKEVGFTGPVYWYFAHYLQAAKKQHPGSVLLYDPGIHPARAKKLVQTALDLARELDGPPVYFVPIDEPRIASRQQITLDLLKAIKQVRGARTMSSTDIGGRLLDIENNSQSHRKTLGPGEKKRKSERLVWEYDNSAITCINPGYSRYIYGYYTWRQDLDGMNSWGFNTAENSRGNPYEDLDHPYSDWNLAYPHPGGPLPSPNWEALREGIDDVRFIYQLEKLAREKAASHPGEAGQAEEFLDRLRGRCDIDERTMINEFGDWTPEAFAGTRDQVISWIIRLQEL